jgi:UDP-N-acetylmuramate dehydrogenase
MQQVITALHHENIGQILPNESLGPYTTWKIGGPADFLLIPNTKEKLVRTVRILHEYQTPWFKLGKGSNVLISDKGIRGIVIKLGEGLETLRFEDHLVYAGAAYGIIKLSVMSGKQGLTGLEFAGGIPGTVGGAVYMNAGAHGSDMSHVLKSAEVLLSTGELVQFQNDQLAFNYRHSILHDLQAIVTEAVFELAYGDRKEIAAAMATYKDRRLRTQPLQSPCAGSVFRNPEGNYAAKLIEEAGLKGYTVGGAEVSTQHANFIVNSGHATAQDVLTLMDQIQARVYEQFGLHLIPEVLVVGER